MTWQIRSVRITVFPPALADGWTFPGWRDLLNDEPENQITPAPGIRFEEGPFGTGRLGITRQYGEQIRGDIIYGGGPANAQTAAPATLGDWNAVMDAFQPIQAALTARSLSASRVAFGVEFSEIMKDLDEAFGAMGEKIDPKRFPLLNARDFIYQINRCTTSRVIPGLLLNRLAKWNVFRWRLHKINAATSELVPEGDELVGPNLTTDVNTDAERTDALPAEHLEALLSEMAAETLRIATDGDRQ